jgi:2-phospho-L-lactate/phosphoenolpyruvate guanylyltransferase
VPAIVVPFRGSSAKARLAPLPASARGQLALAMLADVAAACTDVGETLVVTDDDDARALARALGAETVPDPGGGQGAAVAAALARLGPGAALVVNADLPCALPYDVRALVRATTASGVALVAARDGTTNALGLPSPAAFAPLYGPGSADRFRVHAGTLGFTAVAVSIPNLRDDVDTLADLRRLGGRAGPRTQAAISSLGLAA